ncbi:unnamed protein product [Didymodactylos carnosus]|uniref:Uncharacterized protein n=1 Tax=Didymodactylos carnosus TaxID=1234261 RepID=A0A815NC58_9BILA|nr:unnamed protein product [Didymodactylos carnosus]CAF1437385.1 unnamed protein product [Didymodactylos carnosus]CAF3821603.1 unnamed protein product [Didymodactylos carnosus]CAF4314667.1 unnamed protein product [Didymodactylos carnosus]
MGTDSSKHNRGRNSNTDLSILLNGRLAEGQFNTKFIGNNSMSSYEFDLMYLLKTEIKDETQLVGVEQAPGYVSSVRCLGVLVRTILGEVNMPETLLLPIGAR